MSRAPPPGGSGRMPYGMQPGYNRPPPGYNQPPGQPGYSRPPPQEKSYSQGPPSGGRQVPLRVEKISDKSLQARLIYGNQCAVSPEDFPPSRDGSDLYILLRGGQPVGEHVVTAKPIPGFPQGCISLSDPQRGWCRITMRDTFTGEIYNPFAQGDKIYLGSLNVEVGFASLNKRTEAPYEEDELTKIFIDTFQNQLLSPGQQILMDVRNIPLLVTVKTVGLVDLALSSENTGDHEYRDPDARGILTNQTRVTFHRRADSNFNLKQSATKPNANSLFAPGFKIEDLGIGGLGKEFQVIFSRAFAPRVLSPGIIAKLGMEHVKGMLLYGPPGTGKTMIARQIGKMLNARPPKVINGPELLNKYVGQSEENMRKVFADAEKEYKEKGDESGLHIIIFDELDAICKKRGSGGSGGTGVGDNIVNQLLTKLDGVDQIRNILLIGMTNRKDLIDDALLRPGRLELHVEISLPDQKGRVEILNIHTAKMRENKMLGSDVDLQEIAEKTKNFSGAELSGLVRSAQATAIARYTEVGKVASMKEDVVNMKVDHGDFLEASATIQPAYGIDDGELHGVINKGIIRYGPHIDATIRDTMDIANMVKQDSWVRHSSVLFHGPEGSGKTALAAHIAIESGFPFIKMVTPGHLAAYKDDLSRREFVHGVFADAYKSPASIVILDDFERLIGWNAIGPRFSNTMLEILTTLIVASPPEGHRLLVFITTNKLSVIDMLDIRRDFEDEVAVPPVKDLEELAAVLQEASIDDSGTMFSPEDIQATVRSIQHRTGSSSVGIGIKTILKCISRTRASTGGTFVLEKFQDLLVQKIMSKDI